ncbi:MAG TPA: hypothetical protein VLA55_01060 [Ornithinibacter sp.]|nr:hypothetical protein [Ornithinibacter sp.]
MTSTTTAPVPTPTRTPLLPVAVGTFLGTCAFTALGVFGDGTEGATHSATDVLVVAAVAAVATGVIFGIVVPRVQSSRRAAGVGLGLSLVGLLMVAVFWSGLTPALAAGGIVLGATARRAGQRPGMGGAAVAVGALALVGYVAIYALDWLSTHNIGAF